MRAGANLENVDICLIKVSCSAFTCKNQFHFTLALFTFPGKSTLKNDQSIEARGVKFNLRSIFYALQIRKMLLYFLYSAYSYSNQAHVNPHRQKIGCESCIYFNGGVFMVF